LRKKELTARRPARGTKVRLGGQKKSSRGGRSRKKGRGEITERRLTWLKQEVSRVYVKVMKDPRIGTSAGNILVNGQLNNLLWPRQYRKTKSPPRMESRAGKSRIYRGTYRRTELMAIARSRLLNSTDGGPWAQKPYTVKNNAVKTGDIKRNNTSNRGPRS